MSPFARSLTIFLAAAIAVGSVSYELCAAGDDHGDVEALRHAHGDFEHFHHHHHSDGDGHGDDDHDGTDHPPNDLKAVWTTSRSQQLEATPALPPTPCVVVAIEPVDTGESRGVPPPRREARAGPDPTRQLREIRSTVMLV